MIQRALLGCMVTGALIFAACGGSDSDEGSTSANDENTQSASPAGETVTRADSSRAATTPTTGAKAGLNTKQFAHEACLLGGTFSKAAGAADTALNAIKPDSAGAQAKLVAEYDKIATAMDVYVRGLAALPVPTDKGGAEIKAHWLGLATESQGYAHSNAEQVRALPGGAEFNDAYFELTSDYRLTRGDQEFRGPLLAMEAQFPAAGDVVEAIDNDPACAGVIDG